MIVNNSNYELTAVRPDQYPITGLPEIAFIGRSNVGKSSIINSLLNRRNLARTSATPGKTREINFYNIENTLYFVDLPGYGYASVSKDKKKGWGSIVETYLYSRLQLKMLILLVDIRHAPSKDDVLVYNWLTHNNVPNIVIATKLDKITRNQINIRLKEIRSVLGMAEGLPLMAFSSETKQGRDEAWALIDSVIG